uniref:Uncharacterized protein n=1 Tax=Candidatus Kentrum sp. TUN TaxID=2126343 RepID=A0A451A142_9GAMM|nr:MAG: hypothetical protein BECKTUN1418F_GA0071002_11864 [Candidatus Kentron sp. TUN]VFK68275.1 MAG: hypothetical protein BECKTUN1418E_GA0071001_11824 [Candidatus Kentron sp. TUN]
MDKLDASGWDSLFAEYGNFTYSNLQLLESAFSSLVRLLGLSW